MKPLKLNVPCNDCTGQLICIASTRYKDLYRCTKCGKLIHDYRQESDDQEVDLTFTVKNNEL